MINILKLVFARQQRSYITFAVETNQQMLKQLNDTLDREQALYNIFDPQAFGSAAKLAWK